jgi:isocitrate dehydrogenase kinase/phosphatase
VRDNDIFPEEFPHFLSLPEPARAALFEHHEDLFRADFWRGVQSKLRAGEIPEVFAYGPERRLPLPHGELPGRSPQSAFQETKSKSLR